MSPNPEVIWQQPPKTPVNHNKLDNKHNNYPNNTNQTTQELPNKQITGVASQTSPPKLFQLQGSENATGQFRGKSGKTDKQVLFIDDSNSCPTDIQES